jgi:hypothetical protein
MASIRTRQELLIHLAKRGDASAFYSLAAARARAAYVSLRNAGKDHGETMALMEPFFRKLQTAFMGKPKDISFDEWYDAMQKRHFPREAFVQEDTGGGERVRKVVPPDDISRFESQMMLILQSNSSRSLRGKNCSPIMSGVSFINSHRVLKIPIAMAVFLIALCAVLYAWLTFAKADLIISVTRAHASSHIELPLAVNRVLFGANPVQNYPEARAKGPRNLVTAADSARTTLPQESLVPDSIPRSSPSVRNVSLPVRSSSPAVRAAKRKLPSVARRPPSDSVSSRLSRTQMPVAEDEPANSSRSPDKGTVLQPQQGTQPSTPLDSSITPP